MAIAVNPSVVDDDSATLMGATVRLTNAQAGDVLSVAGTLPAGIVASFGPAVAGEVTMYLGGTGAVSKAALQTAIGQVRFANNGDNPNPGGAGSPRLIEVSVHDGESSSNFATTTVNVTTLDDPTNANNDTILTNVSDGAVIDIPTWALLANDTDPDDALSVTAVSGANGVAGLGLAGGTVSFTDPLPGGGSFTYTATGGATGDTASVSVSNQGFASVADNFNTSSFNNNDGSVNWASGWSETGDNNNAGSGQIIIDGGQNTMRFMGGNGGGFNGATITRTVNLAGVTAATLSYSYNEIGLDTGETVEVQFSADGTTFTTVQTIDGNTGSGNASIALNLGGGGAANSQIRFVTSAISSNQESVVIDNLAITYANGAATINGGGGNEILAGSAAGSLFDGGTGDDSVLAGGGDDFVVWNANNGATDGRDTVDGGEGTDTFTVNGNGTDEQFDIYTRAAAIAAGILVTNGGTGIVISRNGAVIAELQNVEELVINTGAGNDNIDVHGNFDLSSLSQSTIHVNDGGGDDTVDITGLLSTHRVVFNGNGGADRMFGEKRDQDVFSDSVSWSGPTNFDDIDQNDDVDDVESRRKKTWSRSAAPSAPTSCTAATWPKRCTERTVTTCFTAMAGMTTCAAALAMIGCGAGSTTI